MDERVIELVFCRRRFFGRNNKPKEVVDCNGYINEHEGNDEELTEEQATNTVYYKYLRLMARYIYKQSSLTWTVEVENKFTETFVKFLRFSNKVDKVKPKIFHSRNH